MSDHSIHAIKRVAPPGSEDAESLREYGRQLAMDSLMVEALADEQVANHPPSAILSLPPRRQVSRAWLPAAAAVLLAAAGLFLWNRASSPSSSERAALVPPGATLDPRWVLHASSGADYRILDPDHVELRSGEVRFTSIQPAALLVKTPNATSTARGTDFLIGHHLSAENQTNQTNNRNLMKPQTNLTRLLVLAGSVVLATDQGSLAAGPNEAIIARADQAPEKLTLEANASFAFDLYARLIREIPEDNLIFSPYSMSNTLLMVAEGARGQTAEEMGTVLGFPEALRRKGDEGRMIPWEMGKLRTRQAALNRLLHTGKDVKPGEPTLRIANAVWGDQSTPFNGEWQDIVTGSYGAGAVQVADFAGDAEKERLRINDWTARQTGGLIKDLFPEGSLEATTRLALVNAIYFKGDWQTAFNPEFTDKRSYALASGEKIETDMMFTTDAKARYAAFHGDGKFFETPLVSRKGDKVYPGKDGFSMVELPYRGENLSMVVIAPNDPAGLPAIEKMLDASKLERWIKALSRRETAVYLPKFKAEASLPDVHKSLAAMGMPVAFTTGADFSGLCSTHPLIISTVVHQAVIEVNEQGTEAAAATGVSAALSEEDDTPKPFTPTFRADRPFLYLIRDRESGAILFLGRMLNPTTTTAN